MRCDTAHAPGMVLRGHICHSLQGCTALAAALVAASGPAPSSPAGDAVRSATPDAVAQVPAAMPLASGAADAAAAAGQDTLRAPRRSASAAVRPLKCDSAYAFPSSRPPTPPPRGKVALPAASGNKAAAAAAGRNKAAAGPTTLLVRDDSASALDLIAALRISDVAAAKLQ